MKVLMTADTVGGVWSYAVGLCRTLPEFDFVVATMGPPPSRKQREAIGKLSNVLPIESSYSLEWSEDSADIDESRDWLVQLANAHDADVVHLNGYAHAQLSCASPVLVVAHSDVLSWWQAVHKSAAPGKWGAYRERVVGGLSAAAHVVAPTAAVLHDLERNYLQLGCKATVISNGICLGSFPPSAKRSVIFAAGRLWDAGKNLSALDTAAVGLPWPVEIAGEIGHPVGGTAEFAYVHLLGQLSSAEMATRLGAASIFAAPACYEPFGLAVLEAAAAGCALVLGDISSLRENWDEAALFVDPEDRSSLGSALAALIADPQRRGRLAAAAHRRAQHFSAERMARAYAALYYDMARSFSVLETA